MTVTNEIIREFCIKTGIYQWQIAAMVGLSANRFSILMRKEFPESVQLNLVECMKNKVNGEEYDLSIWNEYRANQQVLAQAKRNDHMRKRSVDIYEYRKRETALDEAEQRRIEGGWDTWQ